MTCYRNVSTNTDTLYVTGLEVVCVWVLVLHKQTTGGCGDLINGAALKANVCA